MSASSSRECAYLWVEGEGVSASRSMGRRCLPLGPGRGVCFWVWGRDCLPLGPGGVSATRCGGCLPLGPRVSASCSEDYRAVHIFSTISEWVSLHFKFIFILSDVKELLIVKKLQI